ncbi:MAG: response regulator [Promethearchaeota archaeon]|jgi:DNA-binding NarL/FixJ family response regulator
MKKNTIIKLLVADDHNLFRSGIIKLLKDHPHIYVLAEAENGMELIKKYFEVFPDVVLTDIAMPQMSGLEAVAKIKEKEPAIKALFLSMYDTDEYIYKVVKSGGMGLINKNIVEGELAYAIENIHSGKMYFRGKWAKESLNKLVKEFESRKEQKVIFKYEVNHREEQILRLINEGISSKEMAERLELSKKTIDFYRSNMMRKFNLKTPTDLIRFAVKYFDSDDRVKRERNMFTKNL